MNESDITKETSEYYKISSAKVHHTYNLNKSFSFKDLVNVDVDKFGQIVGVEVIKFKNE